MIKEKVGTFETSGLLVAGDPALKKKELISLKVLPGTYHCFVKLGKLKSSSFAWDSRPWNFRVGELFIIHEEYLNASLKQTKHPQEMCVDSGQIGIFDAAAFNEKNKSVKSLNHCFSFFKESLSSNLREIERAEQSLKEKDSRFQRLVKFLDNSEEKAILYTQEEISDLKKQLDETKQILRSKKYPNYIKEETLRNFYEIVCDLSSSPISAGIYKNSGVNSASGEGDGTYPLFLGKNSKQEIVSLAAKFISDKQLGPITEFIK